MSNDDMEPLKLNWKKVERVSEMQRSITTWQICDPKVMATMQSDAAIEHAFIDARKDIIHQHAKITNLLGKIKELEGQLEEVKGLSLEIINQCCS